MRSMTYRALAFLVIAGLVTAGCAPATAEPEPTAPVTEESAATESPVPEVEHVTVTIGFTASQTGNLNVESTRQYNGLTLWMDQVNAAGGLAINDTTVLDFASVYYDDESNKDRVQELYTRLATEDDADFLISPYSSGLADAAAVIAEQYQKIMITTGAASDATYQKGYTLVFQTYTPASRYLTGAVDNLRHLDPAVTRIAIVHENDKFSTDVATAAQAYAQSLGYEVVLFEGYDTGTTDFGPIINKIEAAAPEAIMGGGHFQDGTTLARQLFEKEVSVRYLAMLVAPPEPSFAELGDAAFGVIGPSQWEPLAAFTEEAAGAAGMPWFGPSGADFTAAYTQEFGEEPSYHAAGGYAAGLILQMALEAAGSTDSEAVKAALEALDTLTFFGHIKFDVTPENHGLQVGHSMVYIQWQRDDAGVLLKQVIWPLEGATAEAIYPFR